MKECELCGQPNGWALFHNRWKHVCGTCADEDREEVIYFGEWIYRIATRCHCCNLKMVKVRGNLRLVNGEEKYVCSNCRNPYSKAGINAKKFHIENLNHA